MADDPEQETPSGEDRDAVNLPGEGGYTIPVPKKADVMAAFRKVAKADEQSDDSPASPG